MSIQLINREMLSIVHLNIRKSCTKCKKIWIVALVDVINYSRVLNNDTEYILSFIILLQNGANINHVNNAGNSALIHAADQGI